MSRVRNAAIAVSENMACYENLANAIILQAVKWYDAVYEPQAEAVDTEDTSHTEEPQG